MNLDKALGKLCLIRKVLFFTQWEGKNKNIYKIVSLMVIFLIPLHFHTGYNVFSRFQLTLKALELSRKSYLTNLVIACGHIFYIVWNCINTILNWSVRNSHFELLIAVRKFETLIKTELNYVFHLSTGSANKLFYGIIIYHLIVYVVMIPILVFPLKNSLSIFTLIYECSLLVILKCLYRMSNIYIIYFIKKILREIKDVHIILIKNKTLYKRQYSKIFVKINLTICEIIRLLNKTFGKLLFLSGIFEAFVLTVYSYTFMVLMLSNRDLWRLLVIIFYSTAALLPELATLILIGRSGKLIENVLETNNKIFGSDRINYKPGELSQLFLRKLHEPLELRVDFQSVNWSLYLSVSIW